MYVKYGFCHLPNKYADNYHKYTGTILVIFCYYSYYKACSTDPGYLSIKSDSNTINKYKQMFKYDGVLYTDEGKCRTCKFVKPARSKHCTMCDQCVMKFDHHCIWINQCVGLYNYRWLLTFLILHAFLTTYGFVLGICILFHYVDSKRLFENYFVNPQTGEKFAPSWYIILRFVSAEEQMMCSVCILCLIVSIMLYIFYFYHIDLLRQGLTTNERVKMSALRHYLKRTIAFYERWI